ncbi:MAG: single-stranded DNA-binding protein [Crocinitomicaceae bacterium]
MATVFETRLIGNVGKDATTRSMERGVVAISFPVAHNKNWKDRKTGEAKTKTTWVNCTIWKKEGANLKIMDFLKKGTLVELIGTPVAKAYTSEDGQLRAEIRMNVDTINILRTIKQEDVYTDETTDNSDDSSFDALSEFTLDEDDF